MRSERDNGPMNDEHTPSRDRPDGADPADWTGADLDHDRSWEVELDESHREELAAALDHVQSRSLELARITAEDFPLPTLAPLLRGILGQLQHGLGFSVLRGFPVDGYDLSELEKLYWGLCTHVGTGLTQNSDASLIHYVTDGALRPNQGTRGVGRPGKSGLHVDLTDCVSLLCVRQAADNPMSWLASSVRVHREVTQRAPELLPILYRGFEWDRLGEHADGETPSTGYRVPVFDVVDGPPGVRGQRGAIVSCRYNRYWMAMAARRDGPGWTDEERAALDLFDEIAEANRFELDFQPGDIQFANNYVVLHGRDGHEFEPDEERKRLLMRIWVDFAEARPSSDESIVRYGIGRHGNLGWTASQLAAGAHLAGERPRRPDGAPLPQAG